MHHPNITIVIGGQAGSCGKGKICGYLAKHYDYSAVTNNWGSNSGHTYVSESGEKLILSHLPIGIVNPKSQIIINAGAIITPELIFNEILKNSHIIGNRKIKIHPRATVILPKHRKLENKNIKSGSTFKGCAAATVDKIMRSDNVQLWGNYYSQIPQQFKKYIEICDTAKILNNTSGDILIEGGQGQDLDINYGLNYPNVTSRMCSASQLLADAGLSPFKLKSVIMVIRPFPIRISNESSNGFFYSGDYAGSKEISWETIANIANSPPHIDLSEYTTVTKRKRRVFTMNWQRLHYNAMINQPTEIALNFAEYLDWKIYQATSPDSITPTIQKFIDRVEQVTNAKVTLIGTGAKNSDIIHL